MSTPEQSLRDAFADLASESRRGPDPRAVQARARGIRRRRRAAAAGGLALAMAAVAVVAGTVASLPRPLPPAPARPAPVVVVLPGVAVGSEGGDGFAPGRSLLALSLLHGTQSEPDAVAVSPNGRSSVITPAGAGTAPRGTHWDRQPRLSGDGGSLLVSDCYAPGSDVVSQVDLTTGATWSELTRCWGIATSDGRSSFFDRGDAGSDTTVLVLQNDPVTGRERTVVAVDEPVGLLEAPDRSGRLLALGRQGLTVTDVIRVSDGRQLGRVEGVQPQGDALAWSRSGGQFLVYEPRGGRYGVVDVDGETVGELHGLAAPARGAQALGFLDERVVWLVEGAAGEQQLVTTTTDGRDAAVWVRFRAAAGDRVSGVTWSDAGGGSE